MERGYYKYIAINSNNHALTLVSTFEFGEFKIEGDKLINISERTEWNYKGKKSAPLFSYDLIYGDRMGIYTRPNLDLKKYEDDIISMIKCFNTQGPSVYEKKGGLESTTRGVVVYENENEHISSYIEDLDSRCFTYYIADAISYHKNKQLFVLQFNMRAYEKLIYDD